MRRLVYAPEVTAYVRTETDTVNISNDIISGSITRRTDAPSSASLTLQNRRMYYIGRFKPMDRIVIFLKKVKPILVFAGYLDEVPFLQPIPEPVTITASCSLKRLEFTYWDPGLPQVQLMMAQFLGGDEKSATPGINGPLTFFDQRKDGKIEDVGFGRMLHYLVEQVGKFPRSKVHVLPIPPGWVQSAAKVMTRNFQIEKDQRDLNEKILRMILTSPDTTPAAGGGAGAPGGIVLNQSDEELASSINDWMAKSVPSSPLLGKGAAFVSAGKSNGIDPRFLVAIAKAESSLGSDPGARSKNNAFGWGPHNQFASWEDGINTVARGLKTGYIDDGLTTIEAIQKRYCPVGAANDPTGLNSNWLRNVRAAYESMGGDPNGQITLAAASQRDTTSNIGRAATNAASSISGVAGLQPGGGWGGSQGPIEFLYSLIGPGYTVSSKKRNNTGPNGNPRSGSNSDHDNSQTSSYAYDIDFGSSSPTAKGDRAASIIFKALKDAGGRIEYRHTTGTADPNNWGKTGGNVVFTLGTLRFQLIYRCDGDPCGGNHFNHVHIGCRNSSPTDTVGRDQSVGVSGASGSTSSGTQRGSITPILPTPRPASAFMTADPEGAPGPGGKYHGAVDWGAPGGTPVVSPVSGTIVEVKPSVGNSGQIYGGVVKVQESGSQRVFVMRHIDPTITNGATVSAGDKVGTVTDWTGSYDHIHLEVWKTLAGGYNISNMIDPADVYEGRAGDYPGSTLNDPAQAGGLNSVAALNAVFNFPGDPLESILLQGQRALMNDVKLMQSVQEVASAGLRTFASHPNGDFMAWFPDYFNTSGLTPYLSISENELINCTINLSDQNLATHVYVSGNVLGTELGGGPADLFMKLMNYGVVNIEQAYLLDTFLSKGERKAATFEELKDAGLPNPQKLNKKSRQLLADNREVYKFLNRYGARPYSIDQPSIRHPLMEFFMAFQWFQRKWAEQFASNVSFTFMPELFPGTIVHLQSLNVNFYCSEVTHSFDYSGGFTTTATLQAPSTNAGQNFGMALVGPPYKYDNKPKPKPKARTIKERITDDKSRPNIPTRRPVDR